MSYGLLRGAFRSPDALCPMRSYVHQRAAGDRNAPRRGAPAGVPTMPRIAPIESCPTTICDVLWQPWRREQSPFSAPYTLR